MTSALSQRTIRKDQVPPFMRSDFTLIPGIEIREVDEFSTDSDVVSVETFDTDGVDSCLDASIDQKLEPFDCGPGCGVMAWLSSLLWQMCVDGLEDGRVAPHRANDVV